MRKLVVAIMIVGFALVGALHAGYVQHKTVEGTSVITEYLSQYPEELSDITLQPVAPFPLIR
jgi:hypothetical protein